MIALDTNLLLYAHRAESQFNLLATEVLTLFHAIADWGSDRHRRRCVDRKGY